MSTAVQARITPDDLLNMPNGERYELVNGELVERRMSFWSSYVSLMVARLLAAFCEPRGLGWVVPEGTSYRCFPADPERVRRCDVSFIRLERMPVAQAQIVGHTRIVPDLTVEVLSPNDNAYQVAQKVQEWLEAGVRLVWVVNPADRTVAVHRATGPGTILRETDDLTGEDVVPEFRCRVGDLFRPPAVPVS